MEYRFHCTQILRITTGNYRVMVRVTTWNRIRNEEIRRTAGIEETLAEKVDIRVLRWFGHVEMMDEGRWPRKVKTAKVDGRLRRGRPRFW